MARIDIRIARVREIFADMGPTEITAKFVRIIMQSEISDCVGRRIDPITIYDVIGGIADDFREIIAVARQSACTL